MGAEVIPKLTYEEFRQFPDDGKLYELIHGEVRLSPSRSTKHQLILGNTSVSLGNYVRSARLGVRFVPRSTLAWVQTPPFNPISFSSPQNEPG